MCFLCSKSWHEDFRNFPRLSWRTPLTFMTVIPETLRSQGLVMTQVTDLNIRRHRVICSYLKKTGGIVNYRLACLFLFFLDNSPSAHCLDKQSRGDLDLFPFCSLWAKPLLRNRTSWRSSFVLDSFRVVWHRRCSCIGRQSLRVWRWGIDPLGIWCKPFHCTGFKQY